MAAEGPGDLAVHDLQTMEELCQPSLNGRGGPIALIAIQATNFGLKNDMIQQVQNSCKFHGLPAQGSESSSSITSSFDMKIAALKAKMAEINKNLMRILQVNQQVKAVTPNCETCGGPRSFFDCPTTVGYNQNVYATEAYQVHGDETASSSCSRTLSGNTITNSKEDLKGITTRRGTAYPVPTIPTTSSSLIVECETEATKDTIHPTNNGSTKDVQPPVVQSKSPILNSEPVKSLTIEPVASPVSAPNPNLRPLIPYPSRLQDHKLPLADLGASINLIPSSVWNKLSLPDVSPTCMTLELANHSISRPVRVSEDVFVKVGAFHFPIDFVVVDFDADPRVPLILRGSFLKTRSTLIDVFEGELTLRVGKEAITFNLDQTSRYSANYNDMTANRIDVIDMARNYLPEVRKELKICEAKSDKSSIDEPLEVELKDLHPYLEYAFLEGDDKLSVIIVKDLSVEEKTALITVLKSHKRAIAWKLSDIKGIDLEFVLTKSSWKRNSNQRPWVSPIHYVPKKGGFTVVENEKNELILTRLVTGWRVWIDYRKLNEATRKDHFPLPFMDQMLESLARNQYYCFLDGFSGYFQIPIDQKDQEKTTFTCPYGTFAYHRMPFGLCNAPGTFQRCMMAIFHDMIEKTMEVFMDDFSVFGNSFQSHLSHLEKMLKRFIKDFSKIARSMTRLLEKESPFIFSKECVEAFQTLKRKLTEAPILIAPDWDILFELMCDASDFAIGAVLGQRQEKHFRPIHYASKTITEVESNYTTTEKEMLAVVFSFEKFQSYLIMNKSIVYTDHFVLKYLFAKNDFKARLLHWVLLLQEFTFKVIDTKGAKNLADDHLSRLENPHQNVLDPKEINESFPLETLNLVSTRGNYSTPWFADFANYHAGNFVFKGMSS
nr:DNA-directed DNA polymerase [Tanacetum cinerariifolium]